MGDKYTFRGHTFDNEKQMRQAEKEAEVVDYLRARTNFNNLDQVMKVYHRILDKNIIETVIGIEFLMELRGRLVKSGMFTEEQIRSVPLLPEAQKMQKRAEERKKSDQKSHLETLQKQNRILKVVTFFLTVLVIAMFVVTLTGKRSPLAVVYEEQIVNQYASWADELTEREQRLREYLERLEKVGFDVEELIGETKLPEVGEEEPGNTP